MSIVSFTQPQSLLWLYLVGAMAHRASALHVPALRIRCPFMELLQTPTETVTGQLISS
jgi:hypothetical protein